MGIFLEGFQTIFAILSIPSHVGVQIVLELVRLIAPIGLNKGVNARAHFCLVDSQYNFFLKNQFLSYEHAKTFVVTGNMSVSLTETL